MYKFILRRSSIIICTAPKQKSKKSESPIASATPSQAVPVPPQPAPEANSEQSEPQLARKEQTKSRQISNANLKQRAKIKLNPSQTSLNKIAHTADQIFTVCKGYEMRLNQIRKKDLTQTRPSQYQTTIDEPKFNQRGNFGHYYTFKFPVYDTQDSHERNKELWQNFIRRLKKDYGKFYHVWRLKFSSIGQPEYLLYCTKLFPESELKDLWARACVFWLFYVSEEDYLKSAARSCVRHYPVTSEYFFTAVVKSNLTAKNLMKFSVCKEYLKREKTKFRTMGRSQDLAELADLELHFDKIESEKFIQSTAKMTVKNLDCVHYSVIILNTSEVSLYPRYFRKLYNHYARQLYLPPLE